jgi:hypothetical protein
MLMYHPQNAVQNFDINMRQTANTWNDSKILNLAGEKIKNRLNSSSASFHQTFVSFGVWKRKTPVHKIIILPVVSYGCETWSLILGEEHSLRVYENRVLRRIFEPKRGEI